MKIHEALRTHLANDTGVAAVAAARIYAGLPPQTAANQAVQPTIIFRLASRSDERGAGGIILKSAQYTVLCVATDYDTSHSLADAVEAALEGFRGTMGGVGGVDVRACRIVSQLDEPDADLNLYGVTLNFSITYQP